MIYYYPEVVKCLTKNVVEMAKVLMYIIPRTLAKADVNRIV